MQKLNVGDPVVKLGYEYTAGRVGNVIEIGQNANVGRVRVHWVREGDGHPLKRGNTELVDGIKTWVNPDTVQKS